METEANKRVSAMLCRWAEHAYDITNVTRVEFEPGAHGPYSDDTPDLDLHMRVTVHSDDWPPIPSWLPKQRGRPVKRAYREFEEPYTTALIKNILAFAEGATKEATS